MASLDSFRQSPVFDFEQSPLLDRDSGFDRVVSGLGGSVSLYCNFNGFLPMGSGVSYPTLKYQRCRYTRSVINQGILTNQEQIDTFPKYARQEYPEFIRQTGNSLTEDETAPPPILPADSPLAIIADSQNHVVVHLTYYDAAGVNPVGGEIQTLTLTEQLDANDLLQELRSKLLPLPYPGNHAIAFEDTPDGRFVALNQFGDSIAYALSDIGQPTQDVHGWGTYRIPFTDPYQYEPWPVFTNLDLKFRQRAGACRFYGAGFDRIVLPTFPVINMISHGMQILRFPIPLYHRIDVIKSRTLNERTAMVHSTHRGAGIIGPNTSPTIWSEISCGRTTVDPTGSFIESPPPTQSFVSGHGQNEVEYIHGQVHFPVARRYYTSVFVEDPNGPLDPATGLHGYYQRQPAEYPPETPYPPTTC